jgi:4'-phosphopantetheinyl transferase
METAKVIVSTSHIEVTKMIRINDDFLNDFDIVIYTIYLPDFCDIKTELSNFLNVKETKKAERFYKPVDKNQYVISRAILKFILAAYSKMDVTNIHLGVFQNKKPFLVSHPWLRFNISHSKDFTAIAISRKNVGIDIEYMAQDFDYEELLPDIFKFQEILSIENSTDKKRAFYTAWTRKESFVKALGKGIDDDFKNIPCLDGQHSIDFTLLKNSENWQIISFNLKENYVGSIAFDGLSTIPNNLIIHTVPNKMQEIVKMTK